MQRVMSLIAFLCLAAFLGILVWHIPSPDLLIVTGAVLALAAWDIISQG